MRSSRVAIGMLSLILLLSAAVIQAADGPAFRTQPTVAKTDAGAAVSFAVAGPTDVVVDVLDSRGKVVRRLGAAALGAAHDPPPPFQRGLEQSIPWDGKDDLGRPAAGGRHRFRVRLGLRAEFDRFIGWEGMPPFDTTACQVNGLAVGPDRRVYVISNQGMVGGAGRSETRLWVLSPDGRYERTLYPFPATADPKTLRGVDLFSDEPNRLRPRVYDRVCPSYLPQMRAIARESMVATSDGRLVFVNGWATELYRFGPRCLLVMNTDGSIPRQRLDGPTIGNGNAVTSGFVHLALAPDEKSVYYCGLNVTEYGKPQHVVRRVGLELADTPQVFFGKVGEALGGKDGLTDPRGVATDAEGRVYVSDFGNDRVVVLDAEGKYVGEVAGIKGPEAIAVHPKTGAVYVLSMPGGKSFKLVKLAGFRSAQPAAEVDLTAYGGVTDPKRASNYDPVMSLDWHGPTPVVYLGSASGWSRYRLLRIEDAGAELKAKVIPTGPTGRIKGFPYPQGVDGDGNLFFLEQDGTDPMRGIRQGWQVMADTAELKPWSASQAYRYEIGKDGLIYRGLWYTGINKADQTTYGLSRTDRAGRLVPFSATGDQSEHYLGQGWRFAFLRGNLCIRRDGQIWALYGSAFEQPLNMRVAHLGPDGKTRNAELVAGLQSASSLRVDSRGNLFVADGLNLDGRPYPPEIDEFAKRLRVAGTTPRGYHSEAVEDCYGEGYGSILKFAPEGGRIRRSAKAEPGETLLASYPGRQKFAASGLVAVYPRISPMSPPRDMSFSACWCLHAIFDVDEYDRLFVPDALQFRVRVLDANFNEIAAFGDYDSATARGGAANLPGPPIPLEFPTHVHAAGDVAYVTDSASCARRIVRVKLGYAAEAFCSTD